MNKKNNKPYIIGTIQTLSVNINVSAVHEQEAVELAKHGIGEYVQASYLEPECISIRCLENE